MKILVVDDEPQVAATLHEMLSELGHECTYARSGDAAISAARLGSFGLAIVDINLGSGVDGISVARLLKLELSVPSLFISGNYNGRLDSLIEEIGVGFLPKPFTKDGLRDAIIDVYTSLLERGF